MKEYKTVKLEKTVIEELEKLKHPGQTLNGVIQELLGKAGDNASKNNSQLQK